MHKSREGRSELLEPLDPHEALQILRSGNDPEKAIELLSLLPELPEVPVKVPRSRREQVERVTEDPILELPMRPATSRMRALMEGREKPGDGSRSARLHTFVFTGLRAGFNEDELFALAHMSCDFADLLNEKSEGPRTYFDRSIDAWHRETTKINDMIRPIRSEADSAVWAGEAEALDRKMLEVMCREAEDSRRYVFTVSVRTAARRCGVLEGAASDALGTLVATHWLIQEHKGGYDASSRWSITSPSITSITHSDLSAHCLSEIDPSQAPSGLTLPLHTLEISALEIPPRPLLTDVRKAEEQARAVPLDHDAFRYGGLGAQGWLVHRLLLLEGPMTQAMVAARIDRSPATVSTVLGKLKRFELVTCSSRQWAALQATELKLGDAALALRTRGEGERQDARYELEREAQAQYIRPRHRVQDLIAEILQNDANRSLRAYARGRRQRQRSRTEGVSKSTPST